MDELDRENKNVSDDTKEDVEDCAEESTQDYTEEYTDKILNTWTYGKEQSTAHDVEQDKPVYVSPKLSSTEQFKIMIVFLIFTCLVFSIVYCFVSCEGGADDTQSQADISAQSSAVLESSTNAQIEDEESQNSLSESSISQSEVSENETSESEASQDEGSQSTAPAVSYTYVTKTNDEMHEGDLILVNQYHQCMVDGEDTASIYENKTSTYVVANATIMLNKSVIYALNDLMDAFYNVQGATDIMVTSAYRSYSKQVTLFNNEINSRGSEESAALYVARPGYSEHQTGLALDLDLNVTKSSGGIYYSGTGVYEWINKNCQNYGFIVRYPEDKTDITGITYEPWHLRYVGVPHAVYITENNLCLEEYIELLHGYTKDNPLEITHDGTTYYVYSVEAGSYETEVPVPEDYEYTISGDNCGYFIVCYEYTTDD